MSMGPLNVVAPGAEWTRTSTPDVPLSVLVRASTAGGADVLIATDAQRWSGLPPAAADDLAALPRLVEFALR